jgi:nicotinate-nucleotide adenylyltransferase
MGLLGGSFDPPHNGHLVLAGEALRHFALERLVVVVTGDPPHKATVADAETRLRLAEAAFAGLAGIEVSRYEIDRGGPSYTLDTARWARERWSDVVFVVGADEFAGFLSWKDPNGVLAETRLGVATRPGHREDELRYVLGQLERPGRVELFEIPAVDLSSTEISARVARGEPIDELVPAAVARLVEELGLYRS